MTPDEIARAKEAEAKKQAESKDKDKATEGKDKDELKILEKKKLQAASESKDEQDGPEAKKDNKEEKKADPSRPIDPNAHLRPRPQPGQQREQTSLQPSESKASMMGGGFDDSGADSKEVGGPADADNANVPVGGAAAAGPAQTGTAVSGKGC